ncbi:MAG: hypothetical protein Q9183_002124 [Haloplaca sp. 2 TL-2023]
MSGLTHQAQESGSEITGDDFIDSFQLPVRIEPSYVEHTYRFTDVARGIRNETRVERWSRRQELGRGGFGTVYMETEKKGSVRAVKELPKHAGRGKTMDFLPEVLAMAHFSKEEAYFVKLLGWYQTKAHIYIAMEYFSEGDLFARVVQPIPEAEVRRISHQLLEGLDFMHRKNFTHRDLKPSNILVVTTAPHWWVKIGDFGVSKRVKNDATTMHTSIETDYTAPEILGLVEDEDDASGYTTAPKDRMTSHDALSHEWPQEVVLGTSRPCPSIRLDRDEGRKTVHFVEEPSPNVEKTTLGHSSTISGKVNPKPDAASSPAPSRNPHSSLQRTLSAHRSGTTEVQASGIDIGLNTPSMANLPSHEPNAFQRSTGDCFPSSISFGMHHYEIRVHNILIDGFKKSTPAEGDLRQGPPDTYVGLEVDGERVGFTRIAVGLWRPRWDRQFVCNVRKDSLLRFQIFASSASLGGSPGPNTGIPLVGHGFQDGWQKKWDNHGRAYYIDNTSGNQQFYPPEVTQQGMPVSTHRKPPTSTQLGVVNQTHPKPPAPTTGRSPKPTQQKLPDSPQDRRLKSMNPKTTQSIQKKPLKSPQGKAAEPIEERPPVSTQ